MILAIDRPSTETLFTRKNRRTRAPSWELWRKSSWMLQRVKFPSGRVRYFVYVPTHLLPDEFFNSVEVTLTQLASPRTKLKRRLLAAGIQVDDDDIKELIEQYSHLFKFMRICAVDLTGKGGTRQRW